jgi:ABC-2 type transport system permease protein
MVILKDVRTFLRDPVQWSQLVILFGLLAIYLFYLPRTRPDGFNPEWKVFICFLNFGAITLILSTFTSRFVFPMISVEGRQMWVLGLLPVPRAAIVWAKFNFALTITAAAALSVTFLSVRALNLSPALAVIQCAGTLSTCVGLCGLAVGLGARMPNFAETNTSRISSGVGGTVNLVVSIGLVTASILLMGLLCWGMVQSGRIDSLASVPLVAIFVAQLSVGFAAGMIAMRVGVRAFERASF